MKKYVVTTKKQLSTLALRCALVASMALALVNCTDPDPAKYTATFNTNGGIPAIENKTVEAGKLLAKPATEPTKEGYTFVGWYQDETLTQAFNFATDKISANTTLYAKWIVAYAVIFNTNGGMPAIENKTVEKGKTLEKPTMDLTKTGCTFEGWFSDEALTQAFDFGVEKITTNITLYAKWDVNTYTVSFNANNEDVLSSVSVAYGSTAPMPENPTKDYHTFVGWYQDEELTQAFGFASEKIIANITLYAKWKSHLVTIPDVNFREKLKTLIPNAFVGDQLYAESADVTGRTRLDVSSAGIEDLTGIHYFTALTELDCRDNSLAGLDISTNTTLRNLYCNKNQLTELNLSTHTILQRLVCSENALTQLDVANNAALDVLSCNQNALTRLDVSNNTKLAQLGCFGNQLTYLDIRGVRSTAQPLNIYEDTDETNAIDTLKIHENLKQDDEVKEVKTAEGANITIATYSAPVRSTSYTLVCNNYDPTTDACLLVEIPDAVFRAKLQALIPDAFEGDLLNTRSPIVTGREKLDVSNSGADSIRDLTGIHYFTALTYLDCSNNSLHDLDVSKNTALGLLKVNDNNLATLDLPKNTQLRKLYVTNNNLDSLDVSTNALLIVLFCDGNNLTELDVSNQGTWLDILVCDSNRLTHLNVSKNTGLDVLLCSGNQLTRLDVSNNTQLTSLYCQKNQLTHLDMRGMKSIGSLGVKIIQTNDETNAIETLKVHENIQDHAQISAVKTFRGDKVKIETYSAATGSTTYTAVCSDYDPTETNEQDRCKDED